MRPVVFVIGAVFAGGAADAGPSVPAPTGEPQLHPAIVSLAAASHFDFREQDSARELLPPRPVGQPDSPGMSIVPSVSLGPIHAFIGGHIRSDGVHTGNGYYWGSSQPHAGGPGADLEIEAGSLWGGHFGGSATTRGVKFSFTLPTQ